MMIQGFDAAAFKLVNTGLAHPWLDPVMLAATGLGTGIAQIALCFGLITLGWYRDTLDVRRAGYAALIACVMSCVVIALAKGIWCRPRPILALFDVRIVGGPLYVNSFPSGHTLTIWASAVAVCVFLPKMRRLLYPLAALTGFSRIYVGAHFPLDVIFGGLLGAVVGACSASFIPKQNMDARKADLLEGNGADG